MTYCALRLPSRHCPTRLLVDSYACLTLDDAYPD